MNFLNVKYPIRNKKSENFYQYMALLNTFLFVIRYSLFFYFLEFFKLKIVYID
jgi:hypothetical protein